MKNINDNLILKGDYVLSSTPEQMQVAQELIDKMFEGKTREEILAEIDKVISVVDFVHTHSSQDMTWLISTLYVFVKMFAYQIKI